MINPNTVKRLKEQGFPMDLLNPDKKFTEEEFDDFVGNLKFTLSKIKEVKQIEEK